MQKKQLYALVLARTLDKTKCKKKKKEKESRFAKYDVNRIK